MLLSHLMRFRIIAFFLACVIVWQILKYFTFEDLSDQSVSNQWGTIVPSINSVMSPVILSVFYEALCPDSRSFFTKQLLPTFERIPNFIQVNLVPYGKAKTESAGNGYTFSCQHGPIECQANKIHACAIAKVTQPDIQIKYTTCMISDNMKPEEIGEQCAKEFNVEWKQIAECALTSEGDELLKQHGDKTNDLYPRISFVPTILLDKKQDNQPALLKNLFKEVCIHINSQKLQSVPECE